MFKNIKKNDVVATLDGKLYRVSKVNAKIFAVDGIPSKTFSKAEGTEIGNDFNPSYMKDARTPEIIYDVRVKCAKSLIEKALRNKTHTLTQYLDIAATLMINIPDVPPEI
jgi:hypothetical protein